MGEHQVNFANFICRFGEQGVLLDYLREIVLPAFLREDLVRRYGEKTEYFFYEQKKIVLSDDKYPIIGVGGRFIKDTVLERTQVFDPDRGIIHDESSIDSAPSAFFLLILNNHKLIYSPETPYAPALSAFSSTIRSFLKIMHKQHINNVHKAAKEKGDPVTRKALLEKIPRPELVIIPLSSRDSITEFVKQYRSLQQLRLRLGATNDEIDGKEMYRKLRERSKATRSVRTDVQYYRKEGLDLEEAAAEIDDAAAGGNAQVTLVGKDTFGNILRGNNLNFQVRIPVADLPENIEKRGQKLYEVFMHLIDQGKLKIDEGHPTEDTKINEILNSADEE